MLYVSGLSFIAAVVWGALYTAPCAATSWFVTPSGEGDATTIAGGLALAAAGDSVWVSPGTYAEHDLQLKPNVLLSSVSGASQTTIDAGLLGHGVIGANGATLRGFTVVGAAGLNRAAVYCYETSPNILENVLEHNDSPLVVLYQSSSVLRGNVLRANPNLTIQESVVLSAQSSPHIVDNTIEALDRSGNAYAIFVSDVNSNGTGAARIEGNTILGTVVLQSLARTETTEVYNNVISGADGIFVALGIGSSTGPIDVHHNTFVEGAGIDLQVTNNVTIRNNIVVNGGTGISVSSGSSLTLACNDVWNNQFDYLGTVPGATDLSLDPLFCSYSQGDYRLKDESPCNAEHSPYNCGDIGAALKRCPTTAVHRASWSEIKSRYR